MCGSLPQLASSCHTSRHCAPHSGPSTASLKTPEQRVGRGVPSQRAHTYVSTSRRAFSKCQAGHHPAQEAPRDQLSGEYPSQMFPDLRPFSGGGSGSRAQLQSKQVRASCWNPSQLGDQGPWCKVDSQRSGVGGGRRHFPEGLPTPRMALLHRGTRVPCIHTPPPAAEASPLPSSISRDTQPPLGPGLSSQGPDPWHVGNPDTHAYKRLILG